ncbi:19101_t:CDS:1, partial [Racocetra persica]
TIKEFIETNKEFARNQENDEARENAAKIYEELKKKMSFEKIEQIIENCEKLVGFELLLNESKKNETQLKAQQIYPPK